MFLSGKLISMIKSYLKSYVSGKCIKVYEKKIIILKITVKKDTVSIFCYDRHLSYVNLHTKKLFCYLLFIITKGE